RPMEKVQIDAVGTQAFQTPFRGATHAVVRPVGGPDFRYEENIVPAVLDHLADDPLRFAFRVHFRRIDEGHAVLDTGPQRCDLLVPYGRIEPHLPSSLA